MKKVFLVFLIGCYATVHAQHDVVRLSAKWGSVNEELNEMYQLLEMEIYQFKIPLKDLRSKKIKFSYIEYKDSNFLKEKSIFYEAGLDMTNPRGGFDNDSIYTFRINAIKKGSTTAELWFRFPGYGAEKLKIKTLDRNDYTLRDAAAAPGKDFNTIPLNKKIPFLAYSLPYEKNGRKYYCLISAEGVTPDKWAEVYQLKHYVIFYIEVLNL